MGSVDSLVCQFLLLILNFGYLSLARYRHISCTCIYISTFIYVQLAGVGMLLFIAHAKFTPQEVKCRFYGPCAVTKAILNGVTLSPLTEESHFVLSFSPLHHGKNDLDIHTVKAPKSKVSCTHNRITDIF